MANKLEQTLGYTFALPPLLEQALTHSSYGPTQYQRLEFMGDRVLGVVVAQLVFDAYAHDSEGQLSQRLAALVRESTLVQVAKHWQLEHYILVGKGENADKPSIMADVVEAIIGAIFIDGGFACAEKLVKKCWQPLLKDLHSLSTKDAKSSLQEAMQAEGLPVPVYSVVAEAGADHTKVFTVQVACAWGKASGQGPSKQVASMAAAQALLQGHEGV
jgi:ribonuclease III